jgi:prepilin-type N-terminal cleavage/methylation domain-containing protein
MLRPKAGFTIVELLVALFVASLLVVGMLSFFINQHKTTVIATEISGMQQDARSAMVLVQRDLRMAGFGVGSGGFDIGGYTQPISVTETPGQPDQITIVFAAEAISQVQAVSNNQVTLVSGGDQFDTDTRNHIAFETVQGVYTISNIADQTLTLDTYPPIFLDDFGATVYLVKAVTYQVDQGAGTLERIDSTLAAPAPGLDPEDLWDDIAQYIQDFQIVYPYSGDNRLVWVNVISSFVDCDGETRMRNNEAVIKVRNVGA